MRRRITTLAVTAVAAATMVLGAASTASATGPGFWLRSHHSSLAECQSVGNAGADAALWSRVFICNPYAGKPGVYELWVRY
ncbi:hypothetical protein ACFY9Q_05675 [Streptomyces sp. NPDC012389]|uniref:hypothetical protein n=1 Tax=unclassified Streptomyces TaxID=2593676 RepID=UPI00081E7942|nr:MULTISPECIES: hypothetical protein [unclassified Streptomyces]MYR96389.1 hypothetical protein [Streptomyces sp. SID4937]MYX16745.1 hypothetical protein [Streptomyces sp. SID8374]SCE08450.1 hypothetical protein GA0115243_1062140 [Streptomyces sp. ScaeMP-e83]